MAVTTIDSSKGRVRCLSLIVSIQFAIIYFAIFHHQADLNELFLSKNVIDVGQTIRSPGSITESKVETAGSKIQPSKDSCCLNLPAIRPSGVFFKDSQIIKMRSPFSFSFASDSNMRFPLDAPLFQLIREHFSTTNKTLSFDIGANRGIYTWFTANLGFEEVHSFEINSDNFNLLQHGTLFNDKVVVDRVNLYPMGLSNRVGRMGVQDTGFRGFLQEDEGDEGPILSVSFDCFAHHVQPNIFDDEASIFVKVDVEGFEIKVLQGSKETLLSPSVKIGAWLMEVGPSRWSRAGVSLDLGISEMVELATHFKQSFVILRGNIQSCPDTLRTALADQNPKELMSNNRMSMYQVKPNEWRELLIEMNRTDGDCNFWYVND